MKIRPLVIGDDQLADIARVIAHAERERFTLDEMKARCERPDLAVAIGGDPGHNCVLPVGYRVVFSIEEHPMGWCSHISVSVMEENKMPNEAAVMEICRCFGCEPKPGKAAMYIEDVSPGEKAINYVVPRE